MFCDSCVALLAVSWVCLQYVIVVFPGYTYLLFLNACMLIIKSFALFFGLLISKQSTRQALLLKKENLSTISFEQL